MVNDYQYCRFCGSKLGINDTICRGCGRDLTILADQVIQPDTEISTLVKLSAVLLCILLPMLSMSLGLFLILVEVGSKKKLGKLMLLVTVSVWVTLIVLCCVLSFGTI